MHNTPEVIDWFKNIQEKNSYTFAIFDIEEFYPSVTEKLLMNATNFAKEHIDIKQEGIELIFHCRKSHLNNDGEAWVKGNGKEEFDVTMGSYDGAEVWKILVFFF